MTCPHSTFLRAGLPPLTPRIAGLPRDERGYPVPFFVAKPDGKFDFRMADPDKLRRCFQERLCWVCGGQLGKFLAFTIGPMCMVNRTTAEPPEHLDCAEWSVKGCPFLSKPAMSRREDELTEAHKGNTSGIMIDRNPGVTVIWTTRSYKIFRDDRGKPLIEIGDPTSVSFWREGRPATRMEVLESIQSGYPLLLEHCRDDSDRAALAKCLQRAEKLLPP